ncbi:MAG: hypothetical protein JSR93_05285 [Verrucomicrobia bacterium]|nr:hypothetical protein [Verrucomicrobiota bacterium]
MALSEGTRIVMRKWFGYSVLCMAPVLASSLETKPWFGSVWEFHFSSAYTYSRYHRVQDASVQLSHPSNDQLLRFDLGVSPSEMWDVQAEVEFINTPRQSFSYRSAAAQARVQWLNDIAGDPVSWTTGFNIREVSDKSLHDVSCPYHAIVDFELTTALGKEWSKGPYWTARTWGNLGIGIANEGSPWLRGLWVFEKNWDNRHRAIFFTDGYFGFGTKQHVNVKHFNGWAKYHHQSIDLGLGYQYHFDLWGDITLSYARRIYAHTFPEQVNFITIAYQVPFSVL